MEQEMADGIPGKSQYLKKKANKGRGEGETNNLNLFYFYVFEASIEKKWIPKQWLDLEAYIFNKREYIVG